MSYLKDIFYSLTIRMTFCFSILLSFFSFAQIKDTVFTLSSDTIYAYYLDGKPVGEWTIKSKDGSFEKGEVKSESHLPSLFSEYKLQFGCMTGTWNYFSSDSILRYISIYNYSLTDNSKETYHFKVWEGDTIFDFHRIKKILPDGEINTEFFEDGRMEYYSEKTTQNDIARYFKIDTTNKRYIYYLWHEFSGKKLNWRFKEYNQKGQLISMTKQIPFSKNKLRIEYDPSGMTEPKKVKVKPKRYVDWGFWHHPPK